MITLTSSTLPMLQNAVAQPQHHRRHGGDGQSRPRWSDVLQGSETPPSSEEPLEEPVETAPATPPGGINILA